MPVLPSESQLQRMGAALRRKLREGPEIMMAFGTGAAAFAGVPSRDEPAWPGGESGNGHGRAVMLDA